MPTALFTAKKRRTVYQKYVYKTLPIKFRDNYCIYKNQTIAILKASRKKMFQIWKTIDS